MKLETIEFQHAKRDFYFDSKEGRKRIEEKFKKLKRDEKARYILENLSEDFYKNLSKTCDFNPVFCVVLGAKSLKGFKIELETMTRGSKSIIYVTIRDDIARYDFLNCIKHNFERDRSFAILIFDYKRAVGGFDFSGGPSIWYGFQIIGKFHPETMTYEIF